MKFFFWLVIFVLLLVGCQPEDAPSSNSETPFADVSVSEKPKPAIDVTGTLRYQDRFYTNNGFIASNMPMKPIRSVPVQLLHDGELMVESMSDDYGSFSFMAVDQGEYVLRVIAEVEHSSGTEISVSDVSGQRYAIETVVNIDEQSQTIAFDVMFADRVAGIFNMLDVFQTGLDFVDDMELNTSIVEDLNVFWQWGMNNNTYTCKTASSFCSQGAGIYVLSDPVFSGDSDEYDDDILLHEFAHHLEYSWNMNDSPGGAHSFTNSALDLRLSWSEGMASAFALSAKKWMRVNQPERLSVPNAIGQDYSNYYVDTVRDTALISVDLLSATSAYYRYSTNEAAVASAILRLQNLVGINTAWESLFNGLTENITADTLESFWDALVGFEQPNLTNLEVWQAALRTKDIRYELDEYELNDSVNSAQMLTIDETQTHVLYRNYYSNDQDWFKLNLLKEQGVLIETFDLKNGADTYLEIFDASYTLMASNDDAFDCEILPSNCSPLHNGTNFSSQISFVPSMSGEFFIRVKTAESVLNDPLNYGYLGRYGEYSLRITALP
jgi:hypothetical protein